MLSHARVTTILPVVDAERARDFYGRVLGLQDLGPSGDGKYQFAMSSGTLALLPKPEPTKAEHTALSFEVGMPARPCGCSANAASSSRTTTCPD